MSPVALERNRTYFAQLVSWCPDPFKRLTRAVLWPFEELLELVAGDPDDLLEAARRATRAAERVHHAADEHRANLARLRPHWHGPAGDAFQGSARAFGGAVDELGGGYDELAVVLREAAHASAEAFEGLGELIVEFVGWYVAGVTSAAMTATTPSGSGAVTFAVRVYERLADTLDRMRGVIERYSSTLERLGARLGERLGLPVPAATTAPARASQADVTAPYRQSVQELIALVGT